LFLVTAMYCVCLDYSQNKSIEGYRADPIRPSRAGQCDPLPTEHRRGDKSGRYSGRVLEQRIASALKRIGFFGFFSIAAYGGGSRSPGISTELAAREVPCSTSQIDVHMCRRKLDTRTASVQPSTDFALTSQVSLSTNRRAFRIAPAWMLSCTAVVQDLLLGAPCAVIRIV